jgi:formylglycine-generating enzyme required for sulfatase activity
VAAIISLIVLVGVVVSVVSRQNESLSANNRPSQTHTQDSHADGNERNSSNSQASTTTSDNDAHGTRATSPDDIPIAGTDTDFLSPTPEISTESLAQTSVEANPDKAPDRKIGPQVPDPKSRTRTEHRRPSEFQEDKANPASAGSAEDVSQTRQFRNSEELRHGALSLLRLVKISARVFQMGCTTGDSDCKEGENPPHETREVGESFLMAAYETTNEAYGKCAYDGQCRPPRAAGDFGDPGKSTFPVTGVDWSDAETFCEWLGGRLPTEAEWELAARGLIIGSRFPTGNSLSHNDANFVGQEGRDLWVGASPAGMFSPNKHGLFDMSGNVREWTMSSYGRYAKNGSLNGVNDELKVIRGGGWKSDKADLRVSAREWAGRTAHASDLGFRCILPLKIK